MNKKQVKEISMEINIPKEKVEKILKDTLDAVSKPPLVNIDCPNSEIGIGFSDKD